MRFKRTYKNDKTEITVDTHDVRLIELLRDVVTFEDAQKALDKWIEEVLPTQRYHDTP